MFWVGTALAGYGDVVDGRPTWAQRELHTWTNLVRVEPAAFKGEYPCSYSGFLSSEKTAKDPLYYHADLTEIAQLHTEEMKKTGDLQHESADGTPFEDRVWPYYPDGTTIGENVAMGYSDPRDAVIGGWMCSDGHRSNIMEAEFEDMGAGVKGSWFTQDFGGGAGTPHQPIAMGTHRPEAPGKGTVEFLFTYADSKPAKLLRVDSDLGCLEPTLEQGTDTRGGWRAEAKSVAECVRYRFIFETSSGKEGSLPETGSYQFGSGCALWVKTTADSCAPEDSPVDTSPPEDTDPPADDSADSPTQDSDDGRGNATPPKNDEVEGCGGCGGAAPSALLVIAGASALLARSRGRSASSGC